MGEAEEKILKMLAEGAITVDEAGELLEAIATDEQSESSAASIVEADELQEVIPHTPPPDLMRFRRMWRIPLIIAFGSAVIAGAGLFLMYQSSDNIALFGFICIWSLFFIALFTSLFLVAAWRSKWLYLNVEEPDGSRFTFGLPLPLGWVNWIVRIARPFVPSRKAAYLDTAMSFVTLMENDPDAVPIVIDVEEDDGERVQIYIG